MNFILDGVMIYMLQMVRALQVIVHLAMNRIVFPAVTIMFFSNLIEVVMFDELGEERICSNCNVETFLQNDEIVMQKKQEQIMSQLQDLGYETSVALKNLGSIATMFTLYLVKLGKILVLGVINMVFKSKRLRRLQNILYE